MEGQKTISRLTHAKDVIRAHLVPTKAFLEMCHTMGGPTHLSLQNVKA